MVDRRLTATLGIAIAFAAGFYLHKWIAKPIPRAPAAAGSGSGVEWFASADTSRSRAEVFDAIYRSSYWGNSDGEGTSGYGSTVRTTQLYRTYLEQFFKDFHIQSVVDAGCGDWAFSQAIDWTGIDYKGYDIVDSVVERDKQHFGKPNIQFFKGDIVEDDLPPADLLICKNVLQHLSNADVEKFLAKQRPKYKYLLITNGVHNHDLSAKNVDIHAGAYRPLDLAAPPFNVRGMKVLTYWDGASMQQVFLTLSKDPDPKSQAASEPAH